MPIDSSVLKGIKIDMAAEGVDRKRIVCPECHGGSSGERSLDLSVVNSTLLYKCHRASCGVYGRDSIDGYVVRKQARNIQPMPSLLPLRERDRIHLRSILGPDFTEVARIHDRIVYKVRGRWGTHLGYVKRTYPWYAHSLGGKALNVVEDLSEPFIHFPPLTRRWLDDTLVVVEDIPSSIKLSSYMPCAAMMGTHLSLDDASYLRELGVSRLVVALDADALGKQYKIKQSIDFIFDCVIMPRLSEDIKDMDDDDIQEFCYEIYMQG